MQIFKLYSNKFFNKNREILKKTKTVYNYILFLQTLNL